MFFSTTVTRAFEFGSVNFHCNRTVYNCGMLPVETSLITKMDTKPQCRLSPRIQAQQLPSQAPQDRTLFAGTALCISRNIKTNITIKRMLIHKIQRLTDSFQIHFRKAHQPTFSFASLFHFAILMASFSWGFSYLKPKVRLLPLQTGREVVFPACLFSTTPSNASTSQQASAIWRQPS